MNDLEVCQLEKHIRITASEECFILDAVDDEGVADRFYYTSIFDAIHGYINYKLRKFIGRPYDASIEELIEKIDLLQSNVETVNTQLSEKMDKLAHDPIEKQIRRTNHANRKQRTDPEDY